MFKQSTDQIKEAFQAMPMQSRAISVLLVLAIVIGLGMLVRGGQADPTEYLLGSGSVFTDSQLDSAEIAFGQAGLNGWKREGMRLKVPSESKAAFLEALSKSENLPVVMQTQVQKALDSTSVFTSAKLQTAREDHAKKIDLARKIAMIRGIRHAQVEHDRADRVHFGRDPVQTASIVVTPDGLEPLSRERVFAIKKLVQGSYAGLEPDNIQVIDANGGHSFSMAEDDDPMLRKQRDLEMEYKGKIRSMLSDYGAIRVEVTAELEPTMGSESTALTMDAQSATLYEESRKTEAEANRMAPVGVPGAVPNTAVPNRPTKLDPASVVSKTKDDSKTATKMPGWRLQKSATASLPLQGIRASIMVPRTYYETLSRMAFLEENPERTEADFPLQDSAAKARFEELILEKKNQTVADIKSSVANILPGIDPGDDKLKPVEVTFYEDLPRDDVVESQTVAHVMTWLSTSWQTLAMIGLGLVALMVARGAAKAPAGDGAPASFQEGFGLELPTPPVEEQVDEEGNPKTEAMEITGGSLQSELVTLVEANPEVAANVIRGWVGDAA